MVGVQDKVGPRGAAASIPVASTQCKGPNHWCSLITVCHRAAIRAKLIQRHRMAGCIGLIGIVTETRAIGHTVSRRHLVARRGKTGILLRTWGNAPQFEPMLDVEARSSSSGLRGVCWPRFFLRMKI